MKRSSMVPVSLLVLASLVTGCGYNRIQTMDEKVNQAQGQIQTQLQRRADLVPNLVNTVKGITKQEDTVFISIANARSRLNGAVQSGNMPEMAAANAALNQGLGSSSPFRRTTRSSARAKTSSSFRTSSRARRTASVSRGRTTTRRSASTTPSSALSLQSDGEGVRDGEAERILRGGEGCGGGAQVQF